MIDKMFVARVKTVLAHSILNHFFVIRFLQYSVFKVQYRVYNNSLSIIKLEHIFVNIHYKQTYIRFGDYFYRNYFRFLFIKLLPHHIDG